MSNCKSNPVHATLTLQRPSFCLDVEVTVEGAGVTAIFGASGSGKTTLLRCFAGLERQAQGHVRFGEQVWQSDSVFVPVHRRAVGMVFQTPVLFQHLSVAGNLQFAYRRARVNKISLDEVIEALQLSRLMAHPVRALSGGQAQRVAVARTLLSSPDLLLMDEPVSALDGSAKEEVLRFIECIKAKFSLPIIYVTHSVSEVMRLADHAVIMNNGKVTASGTVEKIFSRPDIPGLSSHSVGVVLKGVVSHVDEQWRLAKVCVDPSHTGQSFWVSGQDSFANEAIRLRILAKDVSLSLSPANDSSILNKVSVIIEGFATANDQTSVLVKLRFSEQVYHDSATNLLARVTKKSVHELKLVEGVKVWAQIKSVAVIR